MTTAAPQNHGAVRGLSETDLDACEDILAQMSGDMGFDAAEVFKALRAGQPLGEAMGLPSSTVDLLYAQAIARFNAGDTLAALPLFQGLTALAPSVRDHWLGLGICLRLHDQPDLARVAFETAIGLAPQTPAPWFHACELACHLQDWPAARRAQSAFAESPASREKTQLDTDMRRLTALIATKLG